MKKKISLIAVTIALTCCIFAVVACSSESSSDEGSGTSSSVDTSEYTDNSLIAVHENLGSSIEGVTEVSVEACTGSGCHGGSWDSVVSETEDLWAGIGQISDANPHYSHATFALNCDNCHSLVDDPVNVCNECHDFDSPDGWANKDPETTIDGVISEEPLY